MRNKVVYILLIGIAGGFWGVAVNSVHSVALGKVPFAYLIFFPILFGGLSGIFSVISRIGTSTERALAVGSLAGFLYALLSPIFPFIASILAGACLGAGLGRYSADNADLFYRVTGLVKGIIIFPVVILSGNLVSKFLFGILNSDFIVCFIWGFLLLSAIYLTCAPFTDSYKSRAYRETYGCLDQFKSETREILNELSQLRNEYL